jgi:hypothetical protein
MKKIRSFLFSRKITSVFFAMLMLLTLSYTSDDRGIVRAQSEEDYCLWYKHVNYFTNENYNEAAGVRHYFCNGLIGGWGVETPYYQEYFCNCSPDNK